VVGCWHGYLSRARCRFACGPADVIATHCLLLQEIEIGFGFTFLVLTHPDSPEQNPEGRKMVVVVVVITDFLYVSLLLYFPSLISRSPLMVLDNEQLPFLSVCNFTTAYIPFPSSPLFLCLPISLFPSTLIYKALTITLSVWIRSICPNLCNLCHKLF